MRPEPLNPPERINPHCLNQWFEACTKLPEDDKLAWKAAMHRYVQLCDAQGLLPFPGGVQNRDVAIRNFLGQRRRLFVRYVDQTNILVGIPVRKVTRKVKIDHTGFSINVEAWVTVEDPNWFRKPKARWRFSFGWDKEKRFVNNIDPSLMIYVRNPALRAPNFWYVGYTINCPLEPDLKDGTLQDKENYVIRELWDPISKVWRGRGLSRVKHL